MNSFEFLVKAAAEEGNYCAEQDQVTPTQVELCLKSGCDNNIGLVEYGCSIVLVWMMGWFGLWFGLVEGKNT